MGFLFTSLSLAVILSFVSKIVIRKKSKQKEKWKWNLKSESVIWGHNYNLSIYDLTGNDLLYLKKE